MAINVRTKGQEGEREVAKMLNSIVAKLREQRQLPKLAAVDELFQRNQNQSAVGGSDLSNPMRLEIEVKRQEALSVGTWWRQCVESARRTGGIPILIYRQNRKPWRICMSAHLGMGEFGTLIGEHSAEITLATFEWWFQNYAAKWMDTYCDPHTGLLK